MASSSLKTPDEMEWLGYAVAIITIAGAFAATFITIGKVWRKADDTAITVAAVKGQLTMLESRHYELRVHVADEYVKNGDLKDAVDRVTQSIDRLGHDLREYVKVLTKQAD